MAPRTHVRTATTVGGGGPRPNSQDRSTGSVTRQSRQLANDDLDTAAMLGFRRFRQGYKAQSVPTLTILTPGPR